jgi:hypothetical protein
MTFEHSDPEPVDAGAERCLGENTATTTSNTWASARFASFQARTLASLSDELRDGLAA